MKAVPAVSFASQVFSSLTTTVLLMVMKSATLVRLLKTANSAMITLAALSVQMALYLTLKELSCITMALSTLASPSAWQKILQYDNTIV